MLDILIVCLLGVFLLFVFVVFVGAGMVILKIVKEFMEESGDGE